MAETSEYELERERERAYFLRLQSRWRDVTPYDANVEWKRKQRAVLNERVAREKSERKAGGGGVAASTQQTATAARPPPRPRPELRLTAQELAVLPPSERRGVSSGSLHLPNINSTGSTGKRRPDWIDTSHIRDATKRAPFW